MLIVQVLHDEPRPPRRINDKIPRDLETICLKTMAKSRAGRYASACELADDLRRWLAGEPIQARPVGNAEWLWRWSRRNPVVAGLTASVAVLLVSGTVVSTWSAIRANAAEKRAVAEKTRANASAVAESAAASRAVAEKQRADRIAEAARRLRNLALAAVWLSVRVREPTFDQFVKALRELSRRNLKPEELYNVACVLALCGESVGRQARELSDEEQAEREQWTVLALDSLEAAIEAGFRDFDHIRLDPDLDSIRDDGRFKELVRRTNSRKE